MRYEIEQGAFEAREVLGKWWSARVETGNDGQWRITASIPDFLSRNVATSVLFVGRGRRWMCVTSWYAWPGTTAKLNAILSYMLAEESAAMKAAA